MAMMAATDSRAQINPIDRNLLELGYDRQSMGRDRRESMPKYYYNPPDFININMALRLASAPKNKKFEVIAPYGYGFNAIRNDRQGAQSVGLLFQYYFEAWKTAD